MGRNILYTVGHSSRSGMALCDILRSVQTTLVADVRAFPRSSRFPQYDHEALSELLRHEGVEYLWLGRELGGRRKAVPGSPHIALHPDMRSYADHMGTEAFSRAVQGLLGMAREQNAVILCAERRPGNCHRSFLCDYIVRTSEFKVLHLIEVGVTETHQVSPLLRWVDGRPLYDRFVTGSLFPPF